MSDSDIYLLFLPNNDLIMANALIDIPKRVFRFYADGFRSMTIGRKLWLLIIIKLFVIFAVLKLFFFPDLLSRDYDNDADRARAVGQSLLK